MIHKRAGITLLASQNVSLTELHEILVPVQFPRDLLVARNAGIEIVELAPVQQRNPFSADRFKMPIDRIAETQVCKSKQIKLAFTDAIRLFDDSLRRLHLSHGFPEIVKSRKEPLIQKGCVRNRLR